MIYKLRLLLFLYLLLPLSLKAQLFQWTDLNKPEDIRSGNVLEMREEYSVGGVVIKHYKKFNEQNRVLVHERYNVYDTLDARFVFTYDTSGTRKLSGKYMSKIHPDAMNYLEEKYVYDATGALVQVIRLNRLKDTVSLLTFIVDEHNTIIRANEYSKDGTLLYSDPPLTGTIRNNPYAFKAYPPVSPIAESGASKADWKYNKYNDLVRTNNSFNKWKYDDHGNWINVQVFNVHRGIRSLSLEQRRVILYR